MSLFNNRTSVLHALQTCFCTITLYSIIFVHLNRCNARNRFRICTASSFLFYNSAKRSLEALFHIIGFNKMKFKKRALYSRNNTFYLPCLCTTKQAIIKSVSCKILNFRRLVPSRLVCGVIFVSFLWRCDLVHFLGQVQPDPKNQHA